MIQGKQSRTAENEPNSAVLGRPLRFMTEGASISSVDLQIGPATSFSASGRRLAALFTLNREQMVAFHRICRQLDQLRREDGGTSQLLQYIGGEGGTGKSRIIAAIAELFAQQGQQHRLLVTATSGTAAANIDGITIYSACKFTKEGVSRRGDLDGFAALTSTNLRIDVQAKMDWQEKELLIIDEVSMLGARTLYVVNE
jgi:predicted ATP-dependent serine protease